MLIANEIEIENYNPDKVANFLEQVTSPSDAAKNLRNLRFALKGLAVLNRLPEAEKLQEIQNTVTAAILQSPKKQSAGLLFEYGLLVYERGWKWPDVLDALTVQAIQVAANKNSRIDTLYNIAVLEHVSHTETVPTKQLVQEIMQLRVDHSGFKSMSTAAEADILSSFLAVEALGVIESAALNDKAAIENFSNTCKKEYGYSFSCPISLAKNPETASPTIAATFYALRLAGLYPIRISHWCKRGLKSDV